MSRRTFSNGVRIIPPPKVSGVYNPSSVGTKFGDVAYIPGTGPEGKTCKQCQHIAHSSNASKWARCYKVVDMTGRELRTLSLIPLWTPACKYFVQREDKDKPWLKDLGEDD